MTKPEGSIGFHQTRLYSLRPTAEPPCLHTVVRVSAASSQLIMLQVGPHCCLQRLCVALFWFFQLLFCDTFVLVTMPTVLCLAAYIPWRGLVTMDSLAVNSKQRSAVTPNASWADRVHADCRCHMSPCRRLCNPGQLGVDAWAASLSAVALPSTTLL